MTISMVNFIPVALLIAMVLLMGWAAKS